MYYKTIHIIILGHGKLSCIYNWDVVERTTDQLSSMLGPNILTSEQGTVIQLKINYYLRLYY